MAAIETSNPNLYPLLFRALAFFCRTFSLDGVKPHRRPAPGSPARLGSLGWVRVTLRPDVESAKLAPG